MLAGIFGLCAIFGVVQSIDSDSIKGSLLGSAAWAVGVGGLIWLAVRQ